MEPHERQGYLGNLQGKTDKELTELLHRQQKLQANRHMLLKLKDKGAKIQAMVETIQKVVETRKHVDMTTELFEELAIDAGRSRDERWACTRPEEEGTAQQDEEEEEEDHLRQLINKQGGQKIVRDEREVEADQHKYINSYERVICEAERRNKKIHKRHKFIPSRAIRSKDIHQLEQRMGDLKVLTTKPNPDFEGLPDEFKDPTLGLSPGQRDAHRRDKVRLDVAHLHEKADRSLGNVCKKTSDPSSKKTSDPSSKRREVEHRLPSDFASIRREAERTQQPDQLHDDRTLSVSGASAYRTTSVSGESADRTTSVSGESADRTTSVSGESADRTTSVSGESADRTTSVSGESADRKTSVSGESADRKTSVSGESADRKTSVSGESADRKTSVSGESADRKTSVSGESADGKTSVSGDRRSVSVQENSADTLPVVDGTDGDRVPSGVDGQSAGDQGKSAGDQGKSDGQQPVKENSVGKSDGHQSVGDMHLRFHYDECLGVEGYMDTRRHAAVQVLSVEDSIQLQQDQKHKVQRLQLEQAAERLARRLGVKMSSFNPEGTTINTLYRDQSGSESSEDDGIEETDSEESPD